MSKILALNISIDHRTRSVDWLRELALDIRYIQYRPDSDLALYLPGYGHVSYPSVSYQLPFVFANATDEINKQTKY